MNLKIKNKSDYLFLLPLILVLIVLVIYPFLTNISFSFKDYKLTSPIHPFIGLKNYISILFSEDLLGLLKKTLIWSAGNMTMILFLGITVGLLLNSNLKINYLLKILLLVPWVIPEVVTGYTWRWMMASDYGILNSILYNLKIIGPDFSWFRDKNMAMLAVIIANVWRSFPFLATMVYAKRKSMPKDGIEAALMDGASSFQIFRYIVWPYILPVVKRVTLLIFIWSYNAFGIIYIMTEGGPLGATTNFAIYIQKKAFQNYDFGLTAAMSVIMMLSMLIILFSVDKTPKLIQKILSVFSIKKESQYD